MKDKAEATTSSSTNIEKCKACKLFVEKAKKGLCHICTKVVAKAERIALMNDGLVEYVESTGGFVVRCAQDHVWNVPFKVKL